ncbi:MAG: DUF5006 domain-containing protein [Bacteroidales bacterium]
MKTLFKLSTLCLVILSVLSACKDENNLPGGLVDAVPLKMTLSAPAVVMGETLEITFDVTNTEDGDKSLNEDVVISLTALVTPAIEVENLFEVFPEEVTLSAGSSSHTIQIPVQKEGITTSYSVEIAAVARGYKIADATQTITVADYHYASVSIKNNPSGEITEGNNFVLTASVTTNLAEDLTISIVPKSGEENRYSNLPTSLTIKKGSNSVESGEITMEAIRDNNEDEELTLTLSSSQSEKHPMLRNEILIKKKDIHTAMGSLITDERWVYESPDLMFVSADNIAAIEEWGQKNYTVMTHGTPHPNSGGGLEKWKFHRAYEFHKIKSCLTSKTNIAANGSYTNPDFPLGFADQNTLAVETGGAVDNARYVWVTDEGYLRMVCLKQQTSSSNNGAVKNFGTSSLFSCKFRPNPELGMNKEAPANVRIFPGMRIEVRARIRGCEDTGMLPGIWFQGNESMDNGSPGYPQSQWVFWPDYGEIDLMENMSNNLHKKYIDQTFHLGKTLGNDNPSAPAKYSPSRYVSELTGIIDKFHIYWLEWVDNTTVRMGVNGAESIVLTEAEAKKNSALWPFSTEINDDGLHFLLTMMFLGKVEPTPTPDMETTHLQAREDLKTKPELKIPRMEIDWVRFYTDDTYSDFGKKYRDDVILY